MCHSLCTPDVPRKNKSDSPNNSSTGPEARQ
jgi:hypothetical protein